MTKVSIVVPVYNVEQYLQECLDSIIKQSLQDIEIICVDDGSTDHSSLILDEYAKKDQRVKVLHKKNSGYGHSINVGMDMARGEYIAIVESDDWIRPDMYKDLYKVAKDNQLDFVKADHYQFFVMKNGELSLKYMKLSWQSDDYNRIIDTSDDVRTFLFPKYTWSGIYKTDFLRKHDIRHNETPGASYQDNGFWFQTFMWGKRVMFVSKAYYMYKQDNPTSSIHSRGKIEAVPNEFDFIRNKLDQLDDSKYKMLYLASFCRINDMIGNLSRIGDDLQYTALKQIEKDYFFLLKNREWDELLMSLLSFSNFKILKKIINNIDAYYDEYCQRKQGKISLLNTCKEIVIYGAGAFCERAIEDIENLCYKDKIRCVAVTNIEGNPISVRGLEVSAINELQNIASDILVIMAVSKNKNHFACMRDKLHELSFKNIAYMDNKGEYIEYIREG